MQVSLQSDRDRLNQELVEARSDLKILIAAHEQLEERLRVMTTHPTAADFTDCPAAGAHDRTSRSR
jgi:hypothetical protein